MIENKLRQFYEDVEEVRRGLGIHYPRIVLVSKFVKPEQILEAYHSGQVIFGENRVQELLVKKRHLPDDIDWHFVGHLQTNKVKDIVGEVSLIHSVDSLRLAQAINEEAHDRGIRQACLLQVNTSGEDSKYGFAPDEISIFYDIIKRFDAIDIKGLMTIGAYVSDSSIIRDNFKTLREKRDEIVASDPVSGCKGLSMGMSGDWKIAMEEGATFLRVGSLIFGERQT